MVDRYRFGKLRCGAKFCARTWRCLAVRVCLSGHCGSQSPFSIGPQGCPEQSEAHLSRQMRFLTSAHPFRTTGLNSVKPSTEGVLLGIAIAQPSLQS